MKDVPKLIAVAEVCTARTGTTENQIGVLSQAVVDKEGALADAKQAVIDLQADTGAWGIANKAREDAVAAALA